VIRVVAAALGFVAAPSVVGFVAAPSVVGFVAAPSVAGSAAGVGTEVEKDLRKQQQERKTETHEISNN
jgi:hypothetical protein